MMKRSLGMMFALGLVGGCMVNGKSMFGFGSAKSSPTATDAGLPAPGTTPVPDPVASMPKSVAPKASYAWCAGVEKEADYNSIGRATDDEQPAQAIPAIVQVLCYPQPGADRGLVEASRQKWMKRLAMTTEADWVRDAVAWNNSGYLARSDTDFQGEIHLKDETSPKLSAQTPIESWARLTAIHDEDWQVLADELPASALARAAFVARCLHTDNPYSAAVCQDDIDKLDETKMSDELRADTVYGGRDRTRIRIAYFREVRTKLPAHQAEVKALLAKDPGYVTMFQIAKSARKAWLDAAQAHPDIMALIAAETDAAGAQSRKVNDEYTAKLKGCAGKGVAAFTELFAKTSMAPFVGGKTSVFPMVHMSKLFAIPELYLPAKLATMCPEKDALTGAISINAHFEIAGPRTAAVRALAETELTFDDTSGDEPPETLSYDEKKDAEAEEAAVAIAAVTPKGDKVVVSFVQQPKYWEDECTKEVNGDISGIDNNGNFRRDLKCVSTKKVLVDPTPRPMTFPKKYAAGLAPGRYVRAVRNDQMPTVWEKKHAPPIAELGIILKP